MTITPFFAPLKKFSTLYTVVFKSIRRPVQSKRNGTYFLSLSLSDTILGTKRKKVSYTAFLLNYTTFSFETFCFIMFLIRVLLILGWHSICRKKTPGFPFTLFIFCSHPHNDSVLHIMTIYFCKLFAKLFMFSVGPLQNNKHVICLLHNRWSDGMIFIFFKLSTCYSSLYC